MDTDEVPVTEDRETLETCGVVSEDGDRCTEQVEIMIATTWVCPTHWENAVEAAEERYYASFWELPRDPRLINLPNGLFDQASRRFLSDSGLRRRTHQNSLSPGTDWEYCNGWTAIGLQCLKRGMYLTGETFYDGDGDDEVMCAAHFKDRMGRDPTEADRAL